MGLDQVSNQDESFSQLNLQPQIMDSRRIWSGVREAMGHSIWRSYLVESGEKGKAGLTISKLNIRRVVQPYRNGINSTDLGPWLAGSQGSGVA